MGFRVKLGTASESGNTLTLRIGTSLLGLAVSIGFSGCVSNSTGPRLVARSTLQGSIYGGQQPIANAAVQLIAAGISGYGSPGTILGTATTDSYGGFNFGTLAPCPLNGDLVYVQSSGGDPGAGPNPSASEAAIVDVCGNLSSSHFVNISEVTTVAAAYALAPFASLGLGGTAIGTSPTNTLGLSSVLGSASLLADTSSGFAREANSIPGVVLPAAEVNTLANILASCVNTHAGANGYSTCATLFAAATPPGGAPPSDTFQAAIDIALNPGNNAATLSMLASPSGPFQPTLTTLPTDLALGVIYNGGGIAGATAVHGVDVDSLGNVWVVASGNVANSVVEISPAGDYVSPQSGYLPTSLSSPRSLAINAVDNVEVVSSSSNQIFELTPSGGNTGPFAISNSTSLNGPVGIAIDNRDLSSWVTDSASNTVTHIDVSGNDIATSSPLFSGSYPLGIAIDQQGYIWVAASDATSQYGLNSQLSVYVPAGDGTYLIFAVSTGAGTYPYDVAIDHSGNIWLAEFSGLGEYEQAGRFLSPVGGFISNPDNSPFSIAIDGLGRVLAVNSSLHYLSRPGTITVFANNGTLISTSDSNYGYSANRTLPVNMYGPKGVAVDASGNVWVAGKSDSALLVEVIGLAAPVLTPLSKQNYPNMLGVRP